ncbi:class I SAM-dependent methyltransferase [Rubritalea sp.]|uniref:class I SAM-dependent methyltransferase n=1 Tax=Rubritalea sp. TaxID=2109375 RepID=UPI003EF7BB04
MRNLSEIAKHISSLCTKRWDKHYTHSKIKTDPLYEGVYSELDQRNYGLLDIGCGIGLLAFYLRERGLDTPVLGIDFDDRKIETGKQLIQRGSYANISLSQGDARTSLPEHQGDVTILDILQFLESKDQSQLLNDAAQRVRSNGKLIIRSGLKENNVRFFVTWLADLFAKITFWMKAAPKHYPTAEFFHEHLEKKGFTVDIKPFWGNTPFNNYLIVATRQEP